MNTEQRLEAIEEQFASIVTDSVMQKKPSMPQQDSEGIVPLQLQTKEEEKSGKAG
jgi:hypothetical protein